MKWFYVLCAACRLKYGTSLSDAEVRKAATFRTRPVDGLVQIQTDDGVWKSTAPTVSRQAPTYYCSNHHTFPPGPYVDSLVVEAAATAYTEGASYGFLRPDAAGKAWRQSPAETRTLADDTAREARTASLVSLLQAAAESEGPMGDDARRRLARWAS